MRPLHVLALTTALAAAAPAVAAQLSHQMREGLPNARYVPRYSPVQQAGAVQALLKLASPPTLSPPVSLTPDQPQGRDGVSLAFWKPSFVMGTADGGEAAMNFWGLYSEGHVDLNLASGQAGLQLLDCRLLAGGRIAFKVYGGADGMLRAQGETSLNDGHLLMVIPVASTDRPTSAEIWPAPGTAPLGFLGCDISAIAGAPASTGVMVGASR